ncbi:PH domain-containing protein [Candidatus Megaera polyxenophila]|nr:PH domain-containing protein [Candidatus Megaera polyxenophila]
MNKKEITIKPQFVFPIFLSRVMIPYVLLLIVFIIDALDGEIDDGPLDSNFYITVTIMTAILAGIILPLIKAIFRNTVYVFTKDSIICKRNFPSKYEITIPYSTIKTISIKQYWPHKSFGTGSLLLTTYQGENYSFYSLGKILEVQTLISKMLQKNVTSKSAPSNKNVNSPNTASLSI